MADSVAIPLPLLRITGNKEEEIRVFKRQFKDYSVITQLGQKEKAYQAAILRTCFGKEELKIYDGLDFAEGEVDDIKIIMEKM